MMQIESPLLCKERAFFLEKCHPSAPLGVQPRLRSGCNLGSARGTSLGSARGAGKLRRSGITIAPEGRHGNSPRGASCSTIGFIMNVRINSAPTRGYYDSAPTGLL